MTTELQKLKSEIQYSHYINWESKFELRNRISEAINLIRSQYKQTTELTTLSGLIFRFQEPMDILNKIKYDKNPNKMAENEKKAFQEAKTESLNCFRLLAIHLDAGDLIPISG